MGRCAPWRQRPPTRIEPRSAATALGATSSHPSTAVPLEISRSVATVVHVDSPPGLETSAPLDPESSASRRPEPDTAIASGAATSPAGRTPVVHEPPGDADAATGEKPSEKDGTTPAVTDEPVPGAASTPPLVAVPGGVASTQRRPVRPKSSQNVFTRCDRIPIGSDAHDVVALLDAALSGTTTVAGTWDEDPHAESAAEATTATERSTTVRAVSRRARGRCLTRPGSQREHALDLVDHERRERRAAAPWCRQGPQ